MVGVLSLELMKYYQEQQESYLRSLVCLMRFYQFKLFIQFWLQSKRYWPSFRNSKMELFCETTINKETNAVEVGNSFILVTLDQRKSFIIYEILRMELFSLLLIDKKQLRLSNKICCNQTNCILKQIKQCATLHMSMLKIINSTLNYSTRHHNKRTKYLRNGKSINFQVSLLNFGSIENQMLQHHF